MYSTECAFYFIFLQRSALLRNSVFFKDVLMHDVFAGLALSELFLSCALLQPMVAEDRDFNYLLAILALVKHFALLEVVKVHHFIIFELGPRL